jgi:outer membrane lipoprotein-sorting protein
MIRMIPIVVLVLVLSSASNAFAVEAEEILARMEIAHSGLRDMKASFIHVREAPLLLRYADPDSNVVLISGGILWLYYPSLRQAHRYEIEPKSSLPGLFLALQGKLEGLEEKFRVAAEDGEREQGYATEVLLLYPLEGTVLAEEVEMIRLVIRKSDSLPVRTEFREITGDRTLFEFFDVQKNPGLDAGIFRFVPPEGTEVFEVEGERW